MIATHEFNNENKYTDGGKWLDTQGKKICHWRWDTDLRILTITYGVYSEIIDLSSFGEHQFTDEKLKQKLPTLAIETAGKKNNTNYDIQ